jgi:uncharacterized repeat protein (TIGR03803 family)
MRILILVAFFVLTAPAWSQTKYKILHSFGATADGMLPYGPPALDGKGDLYGVTIDGGAGAECSLGCGMVFELIHETNDRWKERPLHNFTAGSDGANPWGGLVFDGYWNVYGTMIGESSFAVGGVFELSPASSGWNYAVIYADGGGPGLLTDKLGNLFGEIGPGDYYGAGAIGEISSNSWDYTQLYSFCNQQRCEDGYGPQAPPIWDRHGNLYGTTYYGGLRDCYCGVIFQMSPHGDGTWSYHILHNFGSSKADGERPAAGLVMDAAGNMYGNTSSGGAYNQGTIFKFAYTCGGGWKETILYAFPDCSKGCLPGGTMAIDKAGNLFGVSSGGQPDCGGYTCGVVFKMAPQKNGKWKYGVVHAFNGADGDSPAGLIVDDKARIFGTTSMGGTYNWGVAFEITP